MLVRSGPSETGGDRPGLRRGVWAINFLRADALNRVPRPNTLFQVLKIPGPCRSKLVQAPTQTGAGASSAANPPASTRGAASSGTQARAVQLGNRGRPAPALSARRNESEGHSRLTTVGLRGPPALPDRLKIARGTFRRCRLRWTSSRSRRHRDLTIFPGRAGDLGCRRPASARSRHAGRGRSRHAGGAPHHRAQPSAIRSPPNGAAPQCAATLCCSQP